MTDEPKKAESKSQVYVLSPESETEFDMNVISDMIKMITADYKNPDIESYTVSLDVNRKKRVTVISNLVFYK